MRAATLTLSLLVLFTANARGEIVFERDPDAAPKDPAFVFEFQKGVFNYEGYQFWGKVKATREDGAISQVMVIFTAYDDDGKFLGRGSTTVGNSSDGVSGREANVDGAAVGTGQQVPAKILWRIPQNAPLYDQIEIIESGEATAYDVPLAFEVQQIGPGGYSGGMMLQGRVINTTGKTYENVQVIVTAYGSDGKFLGRGNAHASPGKIGTGQIGYIDGLGIPFENAKPLKLAWKVVSVTY